MRTSASGHACCCTGARRRWYVLHTGRSEPRVRSDVHWRPTRIPMERRVRLVACGYYHCALVTEGEQLFTVGSNKYSALGVDIDSCMEPVHVRFPGASRCVSPRRCPHTLSRAVFRQTKALLRSVTSAWLARIPWWWCA